MIRAPVLSFDFVAVEGTGGIETRGSGVSALVEEARPYAMVPSILIHDESRKGHEFKSPSMSSSGLSETNWSSI